MAALFPEFYSLWLSERLPGQVRERLANCGACTMVRPEGLTRDPGPFDPHLKCCTYFPFIPNFSLGALLIADTDGSSRLRMRTAAEQGILLPLGLFASPERERLVKEAGADGFGRRPELLCPFFDSASLGCSIWRHRPGTCATYFCKSERGADGLEFWSDVESYLNQFEWTLANAVLWRLGFTDDDIARCEAVLLTEEPGPERDWLIRSAWAEWHGREDEFFRLCAERARAVTADELPELLGDDVLALEDSLRRRSESDHKKE